MTASSSSPYDVLGIAPSASADEIRVAYGKALKDRRHPRNDVVAAFQRLRDPARRLAQDLRNPDPDGLAARLAERVDAEASGPLVGAQSTPLPSWSSLVDPEAAGWSPEERPVPEPTRTFRSTGLLEAPSASDLPRLGLGF